MSFMPFAFRSLIFFPRIIPGVIDVEVAPDPEVMIIETLADADADADELPDPVLDAVALEVADVLILTLEVDAVEVRSTLTLALDEALADEADSVPVDEEVALLDAEVPLVTVTEDVPEENIMSCKIAKLPSVDVLVETTAVEGGVWFELGVVAITDVTTESADEADAEDTASRTICDAGSPLISAVATSGSANEDCNMIDTIIRNPKTRLLP